MHERERKRERTLVGFCLPVDFCNVSAHYKFCSLDTFTHTQKELNLRDNGSVHHNLNDIELRLPITVPFIKISSPITIGTARWPLWRWSTVSTCKWVLVTEATPFSDTLWSTIWRRVSRHTFVMVGSRRFRSFACRTTQWNLWIPSMILLTRLPSRTSTRNSFLTWAKTAAVSGHSFGSQTPVNF